MAAGRDERPIPPWPFTDAIVVVEFTKRDIADYFSYGFWDKKKALVLTVGDVITDVKLPPPDFQPSMLVYQMPHNGWYHGKLREKEGVFNSQYVQFQYSHIPLNVEHLLKAVEYANLEHLCHCVYLPDSKKWELSSNESVARRVLIEYWLLNDPAPSWRRLLQRLDDFFSDKTCASAADAIRHIAEPIQDTTFTLTNVMSTLETVRQWEDLSRQLDIPLNKYRRKDGDNIMNYYITSSPGASWSALAGALYYRGEQRGLTKVTRYFQRQLEPTLTIENLRTELEEVEFKHLGHILESRRGGTKEVIMEEFIRNHPAPSWRLIADRLYTMYDSGYPYHEYGMYHTAVQNVKRKYLKDDYYLSICECVMREHGAMDQTIMHCIFVGPAGAGKSSLLKRLLCMKLDPKRTSTQLAEKSVQVEIRDVSTVIARVTGLEWHKVEDPISQASGLIGRLSMKQEEQIGDPITPLPGLIVQSSEERNEENYPSMGDSSKHNRERETTGHKPEAKALSVSDQTTIMTKSPDPELCQHSQFSKTIDFFRHVLNKMGVSGLQQHVNPWTLYLTDSGGQPEFQELLPALVAGPCVFFVIFPLNKDLNSKYIVEYVRPNQKKCMKPYISSLTVQEDILGSLSSIASTKYKDKDGKEVKPRVMLVATFKDCISLEDGQTTIEKLQEVVRETDAFRQGMIVAASENQMVFTIDNISDEESEKDSKKIRDAFLIQEKFNGFKVHTPSPWLIFSILVQYEYAKDSVISKEQCLKTAKECGINEQDEFEAALQFLHKQTGVLHYYSEPSDLCQIVIRDPQYLFSRVNCLVESTFTFQKSSCIQRTKDFERGIFKASDYEMLTKEYNDHNLNPSMLLKLLEYLNVIVPLDDGEKDKKYFMPCAIAHLDEATGIGQMQSAAIPPLLITFKSGYCPKGLFGALVACLVNKQVQANCTLDLNESKIHRDQICFTVGRYQLLLRLNPTYIYIEVIPPERTQTLLSTFLCTFCNNVRKLIEDNVTKACKTLNYSDSANYDLSFVCQCDQKKELHPAQLKEGPEGQFLLCTQSKKTSVKLEFEKALVKQESYVWLPEPTILLHPENQSVAVEANVVFRVKATGDDLHFQWQKNRQDLRDVGRYCNTDTATLNIEDVEKYDKGRYRCIVETSVGKMPSREASLTVEPSIATPGATGFQHPCPQQRFSEGYQTFVPSQPGVLTPQDLHILTSIMRPAVPEWKTMGGALGFLDSDLTIIQNSPMLIPEGPTGYFRQMLSQWLKWAPPNHRWPTLEALEAALQNSGHENLAFQLRYLFLQQKGYVPQYPQNPSQFAAGPVHQPVYSQLSYPPSGSQYLPPQGYYYGQPTPGTQLPPAGTSHHAGIPPHQQTHGPLMQGPNYQASKEHPQLQ